MNIKDPGKIADLIASNLNISTEEKQELLSTIDVGERIDNLAKILSRETDLLELGNKIHSDVQSELTKNQREFYLRQQMRAIQNELGEGDPRQSEIEDLHTKMEEAKLPETALKAAEKELKRLEMIPPESAEHSVVRNYLEWLVDLPWAKSTEDNLDIPHAREVLDEDHYDLEKIKDRILEYLAVRKLKKDSRGPILCFVGPPGTGKDVPEVDRLPEQWEETSFAFLSAASATKPRSEDIVAPTSDPCLDVSSSSYELLGRTIHYSSWTRSINWGQISAATPPQLLLEVLRSRAKQHLFRSLSGGPFRPIQGHVHHHR